MIFTSKNTGYVIVDSTGGNAWIQSGNAFGAQGILGTQDDFDLQIIRNGYTSMLCGFGYVGFGTTQYITLSDDGSATFANGVTSITSDGGIIVNNNITHFDIDGLSSFAGGAASIATDGSAYFSNNLFNIATDGGVSINGGNIELLANGSANFGNSAIQLVNTGVASFANGHVGINADGMLSVDGISTATINFSSGTTAPLVPTIAGWVIVNVGSTAYKMPYYNN